jgi:CheY-like chemotaxis protein
MLDWLPPAAERVDLCRDASPAVVREARQRFIANFSRECDSMSALITAVAQLGIEGPIDSLRMMLNNIAHHARGNGFPKVAAGAAVIEALVADVVPGEFDSDHVRGLVDALREDFATDLASDPTVAGMAVPPSGTWKILVVDDDEHARDGLTEYLTTMGFAALGLPSADSLLTVTRDERPDLILLDVQMPGIDGFAACRLLKTEPALSHIPVIFLTAHGNIDERLAAFALGAEEFLSKPVDPREVTLRIQIQLARREPQAVAGADDRRQGKPSYVEFAGPAAETLQQGAAARAESGCAA